MRDVMLKAQELAQAILDSSIYQRMHTAEMQMTGDEGATKAIAAFMEKRQAVEKLLGVDLPDDIVDQVVKGVKGKMTADKLGGAVDALKKLF